MIENNHLATLASVLRPSPCAFTWGDVVLTKGTLNEKKAYDLSTSGSIETSLAELSKEESFGAHLKIIQLASEVFGEDQINIEAYFKALGYGNFSLIAEIKALLPELPPEFVEWLQEKKIGPKDFRAFLNDYKRELHFEDFKSMALLSPSKSNGLLIMEYYFDLLASTKIEIGYFETFKKAEKLLSSLKKRRFSNTLSKDTALIDKLSKLDLAQDIKLEVKRIGDKRGLRLEIHSSSPENLKINLNKTLKKVSDLDAIWNGY